MSTGHQETLILWLNLSGTFVFGLSGGLAAVRGRLDLFGVVVLSAVVGLAGGITRDLLIGVPPETFRDWRYLVAVGAAGLVSYFASPLLCRIQSEVQIFDAVGLSVFCVTGASKAVENGLGPAQAIILGAITGIGGGMLRDVLLGDVPTVLRHELYAIPAMLGAAVQVIGQTVGGSNGWFTLAGAAVCFVTRLVGLQLGIDIPVAPSKRQEPSTRQDEHSPD